MDIRTKRVYEPNAPEDGYRVLVDRIWPRGVSRAHAHLDDWQPQLAPTPELRRWFSHRPERFPEFQRRYLDELRSEPSRLAELQRHAQMGTLTLVYAARDADHNQKRLCSPSACAPRAAANGRARPGGAAMTTGPDRTNDGAVVVGVDGSSASQQALRWAAAEARLRDVPLRVVHAWTFPYSVGLIDPGGLSSASGSVPLEPRDLRRAANEILDAAIAGPGDDLHDLEVDRVSAEGSAAAVLVDLVSASDLLVVGSRGRGGFSSLLLGSTSQQCSHHAPCPVVIVRSRHGAGNSARN
jgi:uncharacterized protein YeaO (DUF488 family)/nucleotide-binding universal stress UspA family protein